MLKIKGKGSKLRYIPAHPAALERVDGYLGHASHGDDEGSPLFRPMKNNVTIILAKSPSSTSVYQMVKRWAAKVGVHVTGFCNHALRSTAATNALKHEADIAKLHE